MDSCPASLWAFTDWVTAMSMVWINAVSATELENFFRQCCSCETWVQRMVSRRPYDSRDAVLRAADENWQQLDEADYMQAFAGHPLIGDVQSLQMNYADAGGLSAAEQSGVTTAQHETLEALVAANAAYTVRFGFIFIVCATGKRASEMLALLQARLGNTRDEEIHNAKSEQCKITRIRLEQLL